MMNLLGNQCNLETKCERREFQIRVVCICTGFFAGVIVSVIALTPMIGK